MRLLEDALNNIESPTAAESCVSQAYDILSSIKPATDGEVKELWRTGANAGFFDGFIAAEVYYGIRNKR
mgnify:CR=1 FL=1